MVNLPFCKYSGAGNDFILIDNREALFPASDRALIQQLCQRKRGVGADGIILLEHSPQADFRMRTLNADGSEAEMCGNGIRCLARFIKHRALSQAPTLTIHSGERLWPIHYGEEMVSVTMGTPSYIEWDLTLTVNGQPLTGHSLDTGVPHFVLFVEDLENAPVESLGRQIRHHPHFPRGTNVNFAMIRDQEVWIRTYERGVEAETLACGTGATATAIAATLIKKIPSPTRLITRSGEPLEIHVRGSKEKIEAVVLSGHAHLIFEGNLRL